MKLKRSIVLTIVATLLVPAAWAAVAPTDPSPKDEIQTRVEAIFGPETESVFGTLPPATLEKIRDGLAGLDEEQTARLHGAVSNLPAWDGSLSSLGFDIPEEARESMGEVASRLQELAPEGERTRRDLITITEILSLMSDEQLTELGLDRPVVEALRRDLRSLDTLQSAVLQQHLSSSESFAAHRDAALAALPEALRAGAAALADHGPLTEEDIAELDGYTERVEDLADRAAKLSTEARSRLAADQLHRLAVQLSGQDPEVAFIIRTRVPVADLDRLESLIGMYERTERMDAAELEELEAFRSELLDVFERSSALQEDERRALATLPAAEVFAFRQGLERIDGWQTALPASFQAVRSDAVLAQLNEGSLSPDRLAALERFRHESLAYVAAGASSGQVELALATEASEILELASPQHLVAIEASMATLPADASVSARVGTIPITTEALSELSIDCRVSLGSISVAGASISLGSINFNFLCNPIENIVNAVVRAVNTLENVVNAVGDTLKTAISDLFTFLLDQVKIGGVSIRDLASGSLDGLATALRNAMGLGSSWWNAISTFTLPTVPCPPAGFHTPFGEVGSGDAVSTFNQYNFFIDELLGMIPETEVSLVVKIPAQVAFAAFKFLGTCLESAAAAADEQQATDRFDFLVGNQTSLSTQSNNEFTLISAQLEGARSSLSTQLESARNSLSTQVNNVHDSLTNLVNETSDTSQALIRRLAIEEALMAGHDQPLGVFILPSPWGEIETVREIVRMTLDGMSAVGFDTSKAEKDFDKAIEAMQVSDYKEAFKQFQKAYKYAVK